MIYGITTNSFSINSPYKYDKPNSRVLEDVFKSITNNCKIIVSSFIAKQSSQETTYGLCHSIEQYIYWLIQQDYILDFHFLLDVGKISFEIKLFDNNWYLLWIFPSTQGYAYAPLDSEGYVIESEKMYYEEQLELFKDVD